MKYITVLDFEVSRVFQFTIKELSNEWDGGIEEFLTNKGHNLSNCEWMVHETKSVISGGIYNTI